MRPDLEIDPSPSQIQSSKSIRDFKNALIRRKYTEYQNRLEDSIRHKYYGKQYHLMTTEERLEWRKDNISLCTAYQCQSVFVSYHRYNRSVNNNIEYISDSLTEQITYDAFKNFNRDRIKHRIDKIKLKEYLWYNISCTHNISDRIVITGDYSISLNRIEATTVYEDKDLVYSGDYTTYKSTGPYSLWLNGIPVLYASRRLKNLSNNRLGCIKLYFTFDLTTYCDVIDTVLRARKDRYSRFYALPREIIRLILSFS